MLSDRDYMSANRGWRGSLGYAGPSIVTSLIWANVIVFALQMFVHGFTGMLALGPEALRQFQLWRLGTYMFAHGGFGHIFANMWGLYLFGRPLEARLGGTRFLHLYLTSGLIGGLVWLFFNWSNPYAWVIGASGAMFGVMMAAAMMFPNERILLLIPPIPMRLKTFVAIYAGIEILMELGQATGTFNDRIAHLAHLGGLLGGFLYMRRAFPGMREWGVGAFLRRLRRGRPKRVIFPGGTSRDPAAGDDLDDTAFRQEVDRILDKIGREGLASLTFGERRVMERARERLRQR
jgi:membrane associated rhomboid family serine protease